MTRVKKTQVWLDDAGGTLVEITSQVNQESLAAAVEMLEDTALNTDSRSYVTGVRDFELSWNGWYDDTSVNNVHDIMQPALGSSVTKTWQIRRSTHYYNGECHISSWENSGGQGRQLVTWSATLRVDDDINKTSVALS